MVKGFCAWRYPLLLLALLVAITACSDGTESQGVFVPQFVAGECPVDVQDTSIVCGTVTIATALGGAVGPDVTLAVARLPALSGEAANPPVLFINGGPGAATLPSLAGFSRSALREERELILFDARGTGFSTPKLECPEREAVLWQNFGRVADALVELDAVEQAMAECAQRLRASGVDLTQYDTLHNAADVAALRKALQIDAWYLLGSSYGTTVALEVMRSYPEGVRGVILDAVYPLSEGRTEARLFDTAQRAFDVLVENCRSDMACQQRIGDLGLLLEDTVESFNLTPYSTSVFDEVSGEERSVLLNGADILAGLFNALYDSQLIPVLPELVQSVFERNPAVLDELANRGTNQVNELAEAAFYAVQCRDRGRQWERKVLRGLIQERPNYVTLYSGFAATGACESVDVGTIPEEFEAAVNSEIPVLLYTGLFDPITPPAWAQQAAQSLPNSRTLVFAQAGHGSLGFSACAFNYALDFLRNPGADELPQCTGLE